jgi:uncharacterized CHY-type Zn-finger protein
VTDPVPASLYACLRCGTTMTNTGVHRFRTEGTSGGMKVFFGECAELGAQMIPMESLVCPTCRQVELRITTSPQS